MTNRIRYTYLRTEPPKIDHRGFPMACIAMQYDAAKNEVNVGYSVVHPKDVKSAFSKKRARSIAAARVEVNPIVVPVVALHGKATTHDILWSVMTTLESLNELPLRVRRAITAWLTKVDVELLVEEANDTSMNELVEIATQNTTQTKSMMQDLVGLLETKVPKKQTSMKEDLVGLLAADRILPPAPASAYGKDY